MALDLFITRRAAREIDRIAEWWAANRPAAPGAAASGESYELPRLAELLARSEFEPLRRTLTEWKVGLDELQVKIDEIVEGVRSPDRNDTVTFWSEDGFKPPR